MLRFTRYCYYGYKLQTVCSVRGVFKSLDISPALVHDAGYLKDVQNQIQGYVLIADKGYLSSEDQLNLLDKNNIKLNLPICLGNLEKELKFYSFNYTTSL